MNRGRPLLAAVVATLCVIPLLYLMLLSVAERWPYPALLPEGITLAPWRRIFAGENGIGWSFLLSTGISACVAVVATAGGFIASRFIAHHRLRRGLLLLAYLPFAISPVILGTCIHVLYIRLGLDGSALGVVCAQLIFALGFAVIFFAGFWSRERRSLEELAAGLGATRRQIYRRVLLPIARELLLLCLVQTFLFSWFQYGITLLIGAGKVKTLPLLVFVYIGEANVNYAALGSVLLIIPPVLMLWANRKFLFRYGA